MDNHRTPQDNGRCVFSGLYTIWNYRKVVSLKTLVTLAGDQEIMRNISSATTNIWRGKTDQKPGPPRLLSQERRSIENITVQKFDGNPV